MREPKAKQPDALTSEMAWVFGTEWVPESSPGRVSSELGPIPVGRRQRSNRTRNGLVVPPTALPSGSRPCAYCFRIAHLRASRPKPLPGSWTIVTLSGEPSGFTFT